MTADHIHRRSLSRTLGAVGAIAALCLTALVSVADVAAGQEPPAGEGGHGPKDRDNRRGARAPSVQQRALAAQEGADVRWNKFGTPASMSSETGAIAEGLTGNAVAVARAWTSENRELFGLSEQSVADLELVYSVPIGAGRAVLFQQRFGDLPAGHDGLLSIGVRGDTVVYVSSSIAPDSAAPGEATVSATQAILTAAADAGIAVSADQIGAGATEGDAQFFDVEGVSTPARVRLVAVPTPQNGVRSAWEVVVTDNGAEPVGFITYVDAQTNVVLLREDLVDYQEDPDPSWDVFPASPPLDYSAVDTRERWCWVGAVAGCDRNFAAAAPSERAWDVDPATGLSTFTTSGNNAFAVHNWTSNDPFEVGTEMATPRPARDYRYAWTNQWFEERCNPDTTFTSPQRNDIDRRGRTCSRCTTSCTTGRTASGSRRRRSTCSAPTSVSAGSANDPEQGNAQAGGISGGPPVFLARDNANQITGPDGMAPITNMYLWQPIPGGFYAPCVDGDFDMTVIGHEYTHAISNRMVAGPTTELSGSQAGAMGESWSDLVSSSSSTSTGSSPGRREPVRRRTVRHGRQAGGHPQLRDERQPAQLQRRRVRLRVQPARCARASRRCTPTVRSGARRTTPSARR